MKPGKNLYVAVPCFVLLCFFMVSIAVWSRSGFGEGWRLAVLISCCLGAMGVIWLSRSWLRLYRAITSIVTLIRHNKSSRIEINGDAVINQLTEAINSRCDGNISYIAELEKQIGNQQIKTQILRTQKRNANAIIYSIRDAVIVIDEFDKLLVANEAAEKLFDFDFKSSKLKPLSQVISSESSRFVGFLHERKESKTRHCRREFELLKDDKLRTFDCIVSSVYDEEEQVCGVVAVLHDITREKELSQMKNDFVSHVSHEIKAPLTSINAYAEMLLDDEVEDEQSKKEFYSVIQSQAKRLNRLIENLLDISRIESGLMKVDKKPVSLPLLIKEQLQMIKSHAEEKNISLCWGDSGPVPEDVIVYGQVYADKDMISQVVVNLLNNAVKYTKSGGSIKVETDVDESAGLARVRITDTGVGIDENELEHVFDKFYRVSANNKCAKGTGLGLNLVKQIVEKVHGGRVFAQSQRGLGSTFGFELPLATSDMVEIA